MRILAVYRHYWPDATPYARLLRTILEHRAAADPAAGRCTVFTAQPSYNGATHFAPPRETLGGVEVVRAWTPRERKRFVLSRLLANVCFLAAAVVFAWRRRRDYDVLLANVHPPVLMGLTLRVIAKLTGKPFVLHVQDIHPEASVAVGVMRDSWKTRLLRRVDAGNCAAAWRVVTLCEDMKRTLLAREGFDDAGRLRVVNNFALENFGRAEEGGEEERGGPAAAAPPSSPAPSSGRQTPFRVLFAGNLGRFQDLPRLVDAARLLDDSFEVVFMGGGLMLDELKDRAAGLANVTFLPHAPLEAAFEEMRHSDLGVVSLSPGVCRVAYPSKSMTYLAAGLPVLALVEEDSDLARAVREHRFGYAPGQVEGEELADAIRAAAANRHAWTPAARDALADRAGRVFGAARALSAWDAIAEEWAVQFGRAAAPAERRRAA